VIARCDFAHGNDRRAAPPKNKKKGNDLRPPL
jgi:hypothetical protein